MADGDRDRRYCRPSRDAAPHGSSPERQHRHRAGESADGGRFQASTKVFQDAVAQGGVHLRLLGTPNALPMEGGVPIIKDGEIVGGIGVSGMSSDQDAQVAEAGLVAL